MPLLNTWNWWFFKGPPAKEEMERLKAEGQDEDQIWRDCLMKIEHKVTTVQDFWICFTALPKPMELIANKQGFILCREGCRPEWEDPEMAVGGMWTFKAQRDADALWRVLLMSAVGQMFRSSRTDPPIDDDEIVAVQQEVKIARGGTKDIIMKVWHKNHDKKDAVKERLRELIESKFRQMEGGSALKKQHPPVNWENSVPALGRPAAPECFWKKNPNLK